MAIAIAQNIFDKQTFNNKIRCRIIMTTCKIMTMINNKTIHLVIMIISLLKNFVIILKLDFYLLDFFYFVLNVLCLDLYTIFINY